ncbi:hypothetical protein [Kitasatospora purpeofusca]|uniref:hypothetical protein n=1 Tax=Kitasatospora purpeofusca TaxID=67352 RepID=UPI002A5AB685|nr:hypothetical protein [Kitasatospora purpeofusca]MDY0813832.1 hypothetical protein [Kitasatospora purpeofusca]
MAQQTTVSQQVLQDIRTQVEAKYGAMRATATYIEDINSAIRDSFQGAASTTFQNNINAWLEQYAAVSRDYDAFHAKFGDTGQIFAATGDHTLTIANTSLDGNPSNPGYIEGVLNPPK